MNKECDYAFLFHSVVPSSSSFTIATHTAGLLLHTSIDLKGAVRQDVHCAIYCRGGTSQSKTSNLQLFLRCRQSSGGAVGVANQISGGSIAPLATPVAPPLSLALLAGLLHLGPQLSSFTCCVRSSKTLILRSLEHRRCPGVLPDAVSGHEEHNDVAAGPLHPGPGAQPVCDIHCQLQLLLDSRGDLSKQVGDNLPGVLSGCLGDPSQPAGSSASCTSHFSRNSAFSFCSAVTVVSKV